MEQPYALAAQAAPHTRPASAGSRLLLLARRGLLALALLALAGGAQAQTTSFAYTGGVQTYTVPAGITAVQVVATGASGGIVVDGGNSTTGFGAAARVQATVPVTPGEVLTIRVGGQGSDGNASANQLNPGGYNGGGQGTGNGGGGGATDVRRTGPSTGDYLTSRNALVVAGGSGGSSSGPAVGGNGGTPNGANGSPYIAAFAPYVGLGASQSAPGPSGGNGNPGSTGTGGAGNTNNYGSGGGGGYYGGGGSYSGTGGGGGSSWVTPTGSSGISYAVAPAAGNGAVTITALPTGFAYTGGLQTYTVPAGVTAVQVVATGASGGVYSNYTDYRAGARVQATLTVVPGEVLTLAVGGQGGSGNSVTAVAGGYNGGGTGYYGGAGGGASDVRRATGNGSTGDYLTTRNALVVAGGAGGSITFGSGGTGGTPSGANGSGGSGPGGGATQSGPGAGGVSLNLTSSPGSNGTGGTANSSFGGGGGGGGYYGGGAGVYNAGAGGGGSSWAMPTGSVGLSYAVAPAIGNGTVTILPLTTVVAYTGGLQTYTVPAGVTAVRVVATGAGGGINGATAPASKGALVQATVLVTPGEVLTLAVGGQGSSGTTGTVPGGYNGGGSGRQTGAGGGATDVRRASGVGSTGDYSTTRNALVVAGGAGGTDNSAAKAGGSGGVPTGGDGLGSTPGLGATQTAAGGGGVPGSGSTGGSGVQPSTCGGGGGYYGGGGSGNGSGGGGGGGSSWVMPTGSMDISYAVAAAAGNGAVTITPVPLPDLVVSTAGQTVAAGLYNSLTVNSGGVGTLASGVTVVASTTVNSGGTLNDGCQVLSGPGSFTLAAGGTLGICHASGISGSGGTGSIQVTGLRSFSTDALYTYNGSAAQVTGAGLPATVRTLTLANSAGLTLTGSLTASTAATLTMGVLSTGANVLTLAPTATLSEDVDGYATGTVQTTRSLSTVGATEAFGGLGLTLTPSGGTLPGSTLVVRTTGTARTGAGTSQSVKRVFDIQPTTQTGLNVALALTVRDDERNGIAPANLRLFKSDNAGTTWQPQRAATFATTAASGNQPTTYTASLGGIANFSIWTLGDAANPLPVELSAFTATLVDNAAVRLAWATASEKNSARFEVERSLDGATFANIGTVAAAGSSSAARSYSLVDTNPPVQAFTLYYRLRQVDLDGAFSYSPLRSVSLAHPLGHPVALFPNPAHHGTVTLTGALPSQLVTVYDALGRLVATAPADATGTAALALPAGLPAGIYLVRTGTKAVRLTVE